MLFCSEEMRDCFLNGRRAVDLYYNDALCLDESLKEIKKKKKKVADNTVDLTKTQFMITVKMKYLLAHASTNETLAMKTTFF